MYGYWVNYLYNLPTRKIQVLR